MESLALTRQAIPAGSPLDTDIATSSKAKPGSPSTPASKTTSSLQSTACSSSADCDPRSSFLTPATTSNMVHNKRALSPLATLSISSPPVKGLRGLPLPYFLTLDKQTLLKKFLSINLYERELQLLENNDGESLGQDRYTDIRPWDHNRVKLSEIPGLNWTYQYINASPVQLGREKEGFIATQGPPNSETGATQFWRMVWQEDAEIVIMLTKVEEAGREKCSVYWPQNEGDVRMLKIGEDESYSARLARINNYTGGLKIDEPPKGQSWGSVECISIQNLSGCELRVLKLVRRVQEEIPEAAEGDAKVDSRTAAESGEATYKEESRIVHHFFFQAWPDHDVPKTAEDQKALLQLIQTSRFRVDQFTETRAKTKQDHSLTLPPRIVHCSAGVGRTGTFIALDYFLKELEEGKLDKYVADPYADPIFDAIKQMRHQRTYMVQKPTQYALIYQVLKDKWEERATKLEIYNGGEAETAHINGISKDDEDVESPLKKRKLWQEKV